MNRLVQGHVRLCNSRRGFTLIEMLTVIAIIGVLAAILVPAIAGVVGTARRGALKLEVDELAKAVERYRDKYGDYPPDGSDWGVFQRHVRKAFPQILNTELEMFNPASNPSASSPFTYFIRNSSDTMITTGNSFAVTELKVMDPAEALVFFLGGFSSDPKRPFTGRGGPFIAYTGPGAAANQIQYNVSRENSFFNFESARLTLGAGNEGGVIVPVVSTDEALFHGNQSAAGTAGSDLLPVYLSKFVALDEASPYVYFDSRTYVTQKGGAPYFNFYQRSPMGLTDSADLEKYGSVYPYFSDVSNSSNKLLPGLVPSTPNYTRYGLFLSKLYMAPTTFQVIGPGLDGKYGGRLISEIRGSTTTYTDDDVAKKLSDTVFVFPTGISVFAINPSNDQNQPYRVTPQYGMLPNALDPRFVVRGLDNVANFSGITLEAGAP